ncbi:MAG: metal-dependent phosphohydrolase [Bacteroidetes bacterium]|nr:metal-dependent phosphohydrolase [Bacteroidota bacterium]
MLNINMLKINSVMNLLKEKYELNYGIMEPQFGNILAWSGSLALENISNCDALYHNVDHTIMVTMVGQEIIKGKHLKEGGVTPNDWLHYSLALLFHDIGYVKGICSNDTLDEVDSGIDGNMIKIDKDGTSASLAPYHVDRGKLFVKERFQSQPLINADIICEYIEMTRFPCPEGDFYKDTKSLAGLTRAADFIGQLGDPSHFTKIPALYYEFVETGGDKKFNYKNPGDVRRRFAKFFWESVSPFIGDALDYLEVTQEGKEWISNLHSHVFEIEHYRK